MKRTRRLSPAVGALAVLGALATSGWSKPAAAQRGSDALEQRRTDPSRYASPQNFALELRVGLYRPDVDSEFGGKTPYASAFGDKGRAMLGVEFDWQALRVPGVFSFGPGVGVATTSATRPAYTQTGEPSSEEMTFTVQPLYGLGVLRVDVLSQKLGIPLSPYAKAGVAYALWRASTSAGTSEYTRPDGSVAKGRGASFGVHGAVGVAFDLGFFDRGSSQRLDQATGINHSYLFAEWAMSKIDGGFGQTKAMHVGDSTWNAGMTFEF